MMEERQEIETNKGGDKEHHYLSDILVYIYIYVYYMCTKKNNKKQLLLSYYLDSKSTPAGHEEARGGCEGWPEITILLESRPGVVGGQ